jgi:hypothetical protein
VAFQPNNGGQHSGAFHACRKTPQGSPKAATINNISLPNTHKHHIILAFACRYLSQNRFDPCCAVVPQHHSNIGYPKLLVRGLRCRHN